MAGVVHIPWYATGFRSDALEQELEAISKMSIRYGATSYHVYRYRDDRYKFLQVLAFENKLDFERYWEGDDFIDFRVRCSSWYQIPVLYAWADQTAHGELAPEPVTPGPAFVPDEAGEDDRLSGLHAAEHRALRELYVVARQLHSHWGALSRRLGASVLSAGAADADRLAGDVRALAAVRGLAVGPAARSAGGTLAGARTGVADRFLERNQALRLAVLDASHLVTLLDYIAALASDEELSEFCKRWAARFRDHERGARDAVITLAGDPDGAIAPLDRSPVGRAAYGVAYGFGAVGEFVDGRLKR